jgi:hypothetical protein
MIMISPIIRVLAIVLALSSPVMSACINEPDFEWPSSIEDGIPMKSCTQIRMEPASREAMCPIPEVNVACPLTCGTCCEDDDTYEFQLKFKNKLKGCAWILANGKTTHNGKNAEDNKPQKSKSDKKTEQRINNYCTDNNADAGELHSWNGQTVRDACPKSCNFCQVLIPAIYAPSETPTTYRSDIPSETPTDKPSQIPISWQPMGGDLDGEAAHDYSGTSVSLSSDGNTVAIGAAGNDGNGYASGHTRVYRWCSTILTWHQMGGDLDGEAANDAFGDISLSLASDGNVVAIGAIGNDENGSSSGHTRVYKWDSSDLTWHQMGGDLNGEAAGDGSGGSVSLSSNGNVVAIGAIGNDGNGYKNGHVRVYKWDSSDLTWHQMGGDLDGETPGDASGGSVSLSSNGNVVAIGATGNNNGNGISSGHTRVYKWDSSDLTWLQMGGDLDGEAAGDRSGGSVSLSSDGTTVAIGATGNDGNGYYSALPPYPTLPYYYSGHIRVYKWESSTSTWLQMGDDIDGEAIYDQSGWSGSVSLSSNGNRVAIGAPSNDGNGNNSGHTRVYKWNSYQSNWLQMGDDLDGEAADDYSGGSVSLSSDGVTVAIGARFNDGNGDCSGHVRVYSVRAA